MKLSLQLSRYSGASFARSSKVCAGGGFFSFFLALRICRFISSRAAFLPGEIPSLKLIETELSCVAIATIHTVLSLTLSIGSASDTVRRLGQLLLPGHQSVVKGPCPRHSQMFVSTLSFDVTAVLNLPPVSLSLSSSISPDHAEKMHELPDEYLADALPIAKKIAIAQGAENYNILQVRVTLFCEPRSPSPSPPLGRRRRSALPLSGFSSNSVGMSAIEQRAYRASGTIRDKISNPTARFDSKR